MAKAKGNEKPQAISFSNEEFLTLYRALKPNEENYSGGRECCVVWSPYGVRPAE